jgi:hypothetical protein
MVRGGRAEALVSRSDVSFRLDQKTAKFNAAKFGSRHKFEIASRAKQWSPLTEEKHKNQLAHTEFRFIKTIIIIKGGQLPAVLRLYISVALQQKTGNFKVAIVSRVM